MLEQCHTCHSNPVPPSSAFTVTNGDPKPFILIRNKSGAAKGRNEAWPHAVQLPLKSSNTAAHSLLVVVFHSQMVTSRLCRLGWFYSSYWTWRLGWEHACFLAPCPKPNQPNLSLCPTHLQRRSNEGPLCLLFQGLGTLEHGPEQLSPGNEWESVLEKWRWVVSPWSSRVTLWVSRGRKTSFYPLFHVK